MTSTHDPEQLVLPLGQLVVHWPPEHTWLGPQTLVYAAAPSAVARLLQWFPQARQCQWAAIGPTTAQALADEGLQAVAISPLPDLASVGQTLLSALAAPQP